MTNNVDSAESFIKRQQSWFWGLIILGPFHRLSAIEFGLALILSSIISCEHAIRNDNHLRDAN